MKQSVFFLFFVISIPFVNAGSYELGISEQGEKVIRSLDNDCVAFENEMKSITKSLHHLYSPGELSRAEGSIINACQEKRTILLSDILPDSLFKRVEKNKNKAGPNCFNHVLKILNYTPFYGMVGTEDFKQIMHSGFRFCRSYKGKIKGGLVGVVTVKDEFGYDIDFDHAFYTLNKDMIFETLSPNSPDYVISPSSNYAVGKKMYDRKITKVTYFECFPKTNIYFNNMMNSILKNKSISDEILNQSETLEDFLSTGQLEQLNPKVLETLIAKISNYEKGVQSASKKFLIQKIQKQIKKSKE